MLKNQVFAVFWEEPKTCWTVSQQRSRLKMDGLVLNHRLQLVTITKTSNSCKLYPNMFGSMETSLITVMKWKGQ